MYLSFMLYKDVPERDLLDKIGELLAKTGMSKTQFGVDAAGQRGFVKSLEDGRELRRKKKGEVWAYVVHKLESVNAKEAALTGSKENLTPSAAQASA